MSFQKLECVKCEKTCSSLSTCNSNYTHPCRYSFKSTVLKCSKPGYLVLQCIYKLIVSIHLLCTVNFNDLIYLRRGGSFLLIKKSELIWNLYEFLLSESGDIIDCASMFNSPEPPPLNRNEFKGSDRYTVMNSSQSAPLTCSREVNIVYLVLDWVVFIVMCLHIVYKTCNINKSCNKISDDKIKRIYWVYILSGECCSVNLSWYY